MVRVSGDFTVDGTPRVESIEGDQAERFEQTLAEWDTVHMTLQSAIVFELDNRVKQTHESYSLNEELSVDCISRYDSDEDPGIEFEEFPTELTERVLDKYDLPTTPLGDPKNEKEWMDWKARVDAIEKPDETIDFSSIVSACPECGTDLDGDEAFCTKCGADLSATVTTCPECEADLDGDEAFCPECGEDLSG